MKPPVRIECGAAAEIRLPGERVSRYDRPGKPPVWQKGLATCPQGADARRETYERWEASWGGFRAYVWDVSGLWCLQVEDDFNCHSHMTGIKTRERAMKLAAWMLASVHPEADLND